MCYNILVIVMRQRNVKNKKEIINNAKYIIKDPNNYKGHWQNLFQNENPIYIEIGMGKGDFLLNNAMKYPNINFIGIEKYDSIIALAIKPPNSGLIPTGQWMPGRLISISFPV